MTRIPIDDDDMDLHDAAPGDSDDQSAAQTPGQSSFEAQATQTVYR